MIEAVKEYFDSNQIVSFGSSDVVDTGDVVKLCQNCRRKLTMVLVKQQR